jgi:hypothetical protein
VGNRDVTSGIGKVKTSLDTGEYEAIQVAGLIALQTSDAVLARIPNTVVCFAAQVLVPLQRDISGFPLLNPQSR